MARTLGSNKPDAEQKQLGSRANNEKQELGSRAIVEKKQPRSRAIVQKKVRVNNSGKSGKQGKPGKPGKSSWAKVQHIAEEKSITMDIIEAIRHYAKTEDLQREELVKKIDDARAALGHLDDHCIEVVNEVMKDFQRQITRYKRKWKHAVLVSKWLG
jgi:hypothetical protein